MTSSPVTAPSGGRFRKLIIFYLKNIDNLKMSAPTIRFPDPWAPPQRRQRHWILPNWRRCIPPPPLPPEAVLQALPEHRVARVQLSHFTGQAGGGERLWYHGDAVPLPPHHPGCGSRDCHSHQRGLPHTRQLDAPMLPWPSEPRSGPGGWWPSAGGRGLERRGGDAGGPGNTRDRRGEETSCILQEIFQQRSRQRTMATACNWLKDCGFDILIYTVLCFYLIYTVLCFYFVCICHLMLACQTGGGRGHEGINAEINNNIQNRKTK